MIKNHAAFNQRRFKIYLVELDDDDRERVLSGVVGSFELETNCDSFMYMEQSTIRATLVPDASGHVLKVETFDDWS